MCEFKILRKNDDVQIGEDIVILGYSEDNDLIIKDILGMGENLESALILDVNTMNQTCVILQHPLVKDFVSIIRNINTDQVSKSEIEKFQNKLDTIKSTLEK